MPVTFDVEERANQRAAAELGDHHQRAIAPLARLPFTKFYQVKLNGRSTERTRA